MSAYIKLSTLEYPRHLGDINADPAGEQDYAHVHWQDPPEYNPATQRCNEAAPRMVDGEWVMTWVVRDATPEEIRIASLTYEERLLEQEKFFSEVENGQSSSLNGDNYEITYIN